MLRLGLLVGGEVRPFDDILRSIESARVAGFESVWCSNARALWDPFALASALATSSPIERLGVCVVDPYSQHPFLVARSAATLQDLSGGRATLAVGAGGTGFSAMGLRRSRPVEAVRDAVTAIRLLLRGQAVRGADGADYRLDLPIDSPVPVIVAGRGRRMIKLSGSVGDGIMISHHLTPETFTVGMELAASGRQEPSQKFLTFLRADVCICSDISRGVDALRQSVALSIGNSWSDDDLFRRLGVTVPDRRTRKSLYEKTHELDVRDATAAASITDDAVRKLAWIGPAHAVAQAAAEVCASAEVELVLRFHVLKGRSLEQDIHEFARAISDL